MRKTPFRSLFLLPVLAGLVACGGGEPDPAADSRTAEGEVLDGSISDSMIPLDQLQSQGEALAASPTSEGADSTADTEDSVGPPSEGDEEVAEEVADPDAESAPG